eukprot:TRINITY_DN2541_c0_g1_i1.p1 TRINITY_DN2541_c0_g1~~TRINITY_DN2541_c0_g1_i1.p1  ORF type:complete len:145 (+),score=32.32 TRINITY_DN2541_c0_g1_i1:19-453(+)
MTFNGLQFGFNLTPSVAANVNKPMFEVDAASKSPNFNETNVFNTNNNWNNINRPFNNNPKNNINTNLIRNINKKNGGFTFGNTDLNNNQFGTNHQNNLFGNTNKNNGDLLLEILILTIINLELIIKTTYLGILTKTMGIYFWKY